VDPRGHHPRHGCGRMARFGSATSFTVHSMTPRTHLNDMIFWSVLIYAFAGSETASLMGDESRMRVALSLGAFSGRSHGYALLHSGHCRRAGSIADMSP